MHDLTMLSAAELTLLERAVVSERARRAAAGDTLDAGLTYAANLLQSAFGWQVSGEGSALTADGRRVLVRISSDDLGTFASIPDPGVDAFDLVACITLRATTRAVTRAVLVTRAEVGRRGAAAADGSVALDAAALALGRGVHDITDPLRRCAARRGGQRTKVRAEAPCPRALLRAQLAASLAISAAAQG